MSAVICRTMQWQDLADVIRIQAEAYIDEILETDEVIQARFEQTPDTSWVVEREGIVCGYLVGYHSTMGDVTPWGAEFEHKPNANTLYLHDLAISSSAKGFGLGPLVVNHALAEARARQFGHVALVSVQNSKNFWEKQGFIAFDDLLQIQQQNLDTYSGPAFYMVRTLIA